MNEFLIYYINKFLNKLMSLDNNICLDIFKISKDFEIKPYNLFLITQRFTELLILNSYYFISVASLTYIVFMLF